MEVMLYVLGSIRWCQLKGCERLCWEVGIFTASHSSSQPSRPSINDSYLAVMLETNKALVDFIYGVITNLVEFLPEKND